MPSSPTFKDHQRHLRRFFYTGVSLTPQDALQEGKAANAQNVRSYMDGTVGVRYGVIHRLSAALADPIHSIARLDDPVAAVNRRFLGSGTDLYAQTPGAGGTSLADAGYSGNPLSGVVAAPVMSPRPWLYIGDSAQNRKINSALTELPIGLAQPNSPPEATQAAVQTTFLNEVGVAAWTSYGANVTPGAPTPAPTVDRINTVLTQVLYDSGTAGMVSLAFADMTNVTEGASVDIGAGAETMVVQSVYPPVSPTTIAAILYDVGTSGLCTIQPTGGFAIGQIEAPLPEQIRRRYEDLGMDAPPRITVRRTVDFPVNCLIELTGGAGVEVVRIESVAVGPDGVQSFRCRTGFTFVSGDAIVGLSSLRGYLSTTAVVGGPAVALALEVVFTPTLDPEVGGVQSPIFGGTVDGGLVGNRATQPGDLITFGINLSQFGSVQAVRLLLDVDPTGPAFLENYYLYEWRASDLLSAIQSASPAATALITEAQASAVRTGTSESLYQDQYGQDPRQASSSVVDTGEDGSGGYVAGQGAISTGRTAIARDNSVSTGSAISRQLSLGDDQWTTLQCRVGDLTRVGTDTTLTLSNIHNAAVLVQLENPDSPPAFVPITIRVSDIFLMGGFGPDVGVTLAPYVYRYRYRDTVTGAKSNPSPPMRAGVQPRRNRVELTGTASATTGVVVDWFRYGGGLARWSYVGTGENSPATFDDDMADSQIDGGERLRNDVFQPWPVADLPRSGTCAVAGTAVEQTGGDSFDVRWAPGSPIIVNGITTSLYQSPQSTTRLYVVDNCGSGTGVAFSLPAPTILAQPLRTLWGGSIGGAWFHFACGDPTDPGALHWTEGNDPDATSEARMLVVTPASEPLQHGFFFDGVPFVFSTEKLYRIVPTFGQISDFAVVETGCLKGLWAPWAFCVTTKGIYFVAKDGIYFTGGGTPAEPLTDPDFTILFPQDGTDSESIRGLDPIDFTEPTRLRLAEIDKLIYFDYVTTTGNDRTMVFDPRTKGWTPDLYARAGAIVRVAEPGDQVHDHLLGGSDGQLYQMELTHTCDGGDTAIPWFLWTPWDHGTDPRATKQWGDSILDMHPGGSFTGITVTPVIINGNVSLPPTIAGIGGLVRDTFIIENNAGDGALSRNFGLIISGDIDCCDTQRPLLYLWEPSYLFKQTTIARRATDWEDLGYNGAKFVQGVVIRANTTGDAKQVEVQYDGGTVALTLTLTHDGEQTIAYPLAAAGWTPFIAELVRLEGADAVEWNLLDWRWVWEPAPELVTQWETQDTTFDYPGFVMVHDGVMAYAATADVSLTIWHDATPLTYTLPSTAGAYQRVYVRFAAAKGKSVRFRFTAVEPFRLFQKDCTTRVQAWGLSGGFQQMKPFGGPHRAVGAEI